MSRIAAVHPSSTQPRLVIASKTNGGYYRHTTPFQGGMFSIDAASPENRDYQPTVTGFDAPSSFSPDGEWIAFHSSNETDRQIYKVRINGTDRLQLTSGPFLNGYPSWSPDGKWIAYISIQDSKPNLYRMRADGSQKRLIVADVHASSLASWSPNSRWLSVALLRDGNWDIYRVHADGSALDRLTDRSSIENLPSWSPDGHSIAYLSNQSDGWNLFIMSSNGEQLTQLTQRQQPAQRPVTWSPDSDWLAFESSDGDIVRIRHDGTQSQKLTLSAEHDLYPNWSPDGRWIAYITTSPLGTSDLYKMRPDGSDRQRLLQDYAAYRPIWSPQSDRPEIFAWLLMLSLILIIGATVVILAIYRRRTFTESAF